MLNNNKSRILEINRFLRNEVLFFLSPLEQFSILMLNKAFMAGYNKSKDIIDLAYNLKTMDFKTITRSRFDIVSIYKTLSNRYLNLTKNQIALISAAVIEYQSAKTGQTEIELYSLEKELEDAVMLVNLLSREIHTYVFSIDINWDLLFNNPRSLALVKALFKQIKFISTLPKECVCHLNKANLNFIIREFVLDKDTMEELVKSPTLLEYFRKFPNTILSLNIQVQFSNYVQEIINLNSKSLQKVCFENDLYLPTNQDQLIGNWEIGIIYVDDLVKLGNSLKNSSHRIFSIGTLRIDDESFTPALQFLNQATNIRDLSLRFEGSTSILLSNIYIVKFRTTKHSIHKNIKAIR